MTSNNHKTALEMPEIEKALSALDAIMERYNGDYNQVAALMGCSYAQLHMVHNRKQAPSKPFAVRTYLTKKKLDAHLNYKRRPRIIRRSITFEPDQKDLAEYLDNLPMEQRRQMVADHQARSN